MPESLPVRDLTKGCLAGIPVGGLSVEADFGTSAATVFKKADRFDICEGEGGGWSEGGTCRHGGGFCDVGCPVGYGESQELKESRCILKGGPDVAKACRGGKAARQEAEGARRVAEEAPKQGGKRQGGDVGRRGGRKGRRRGRHRCRGGNEESPGVGKNAGRR